MGQPPLKRKKKYGVGIKCKRCSVSAGCSLLKVEHLPPPLVNLSSCYSSLPHLDLQLVIFILLYIVLYLVSIYDRYGINLCVYIYHMTECLRMNVC